MDDQNEPLMKCMEQMSSEVAVLSKQIDGVVWEISSLRNLIWYGFIGWAILYIILLVIALQ